MSTQRPPSPVRSPEQCLQKLKDLQRQVSNPLPEDAGQPRTPQALLGGLYNFMTRELRKLGTLFNKSQDELRQKDLEIQKLTAQLEVCDSPLSQTLLMLQDCSWPLFLNSNLRSAKPPNYSRLNRSKSPRFFQPSHKPRCWSRLFWRPLQNISISCPASPRQRAFHNQQLVV